ncbi:MAG: hypothetical protein EAY81_11350 [Bacteroidetes bacterium]|nr:MAG: hypothetical protein EAY81_11350 [Bacteroidota bacterium]
MYDCVIILFMAFRIQLTLLLTTLVSVAFAQQQLTSFTEVLDNLKAGKAVNVVLHYGKCTLVSEGDTLKSPAAIGGMPLMPYEYFPAKLFGNPLAFIACSETVLISHRKYRYVNNYVKLKILENNQVEITARYLLPKSLKVVMDETFYGKINDGKNNEGIYFYSNN